MTARIIMKLVVADVAIDTPGTRIYTLRHPTRPTLPPPTPGAHVDVRLPDGKVRQYSLCGDPADATSYRIAVRREDQGRGGSRWLHENVAVGTVLHVSAPRNNFALAAGAERHVFIAGGIGITPFASMIMTARQTGTPFVLEYCVRSAADAPLLAALRRLCTPDELRLWSSEQGCRFSAADLGPPVAGTHVYCCGPGRLVDAVREATASWPEEQVHFEVFAATLDENFKPEPFDIRIASTGETIRVAADQSALDALQAHGYNLASSCHLGVCGSCECGYSDGQVIHRDSVLGISARQDRMMPCVSRARVSVTLEL